MTKKKKKAEASASAPYMELIYTILKAEKSNIKAKDYFAENSLTLSPISKFKKHKTYDLVVFSRLIKWIAADLDFKVSSRGWAYQLESYNIIDKSEFDKYQSLINRCRKLGILSIDFVAEESSRKFEQIWEVINKTPMEMIKDILDDIDNVPYYKYTDRDGYSSPVDYWKGEKYYIQMLVEKIDLVSLFEPICEKYKIPIANSKGWSSISQRADMIKRFKFHEDAGRRPILLYCGDHDPAGIKISDSLKKNCYDLELGTDWNPKYLVVDRFGLNYDFILANNLTWIDNLITGSGKIADVSKTHIAEYVTQYGNRKCEANAIIARPKAARKLCEDAIQKYLGKDGESRFRKKRSKLVKKFDAIRDDEKFKEAKEELARILDSIVLDEEDEDDENDGEEE